MFVVCLTYYDTVTEFGTYYQKIVEFDDVHKAREYYQEMKNIYKDDGLVGVSTDAQGGYCYE